MKKETNANQSKHPVYLCQLTCHYDKKLRFMRIS